MSAVGVAVLDYGLGNIRSIRNALVNLGGHPVVTRTEDEILQAAGLILPGVGAFPHGMENLQKYGLTDLIRRFVDSGKPVMGICLGMQMLMEFSEEHGRCHGLGLIEGGVRKLPLKISQVHRLPHVGWNGIHPSSGDTWKDGVLKSVAPGQKLYFVHSFSAYPHKQDDVYAWTEYGGTRFVSAVRRMHVTGFQFHPEKSGEPGLSILRNFLLECEERVSFGSGECDDS